MTYQRLIDKTASPTALGLLILKNLHHSAGEEQTENREKPIAQSYCGADLNPVSITIRLSDGWSEDVVPKDAFRHSGKRTVVDRGTFGFASQGQFHAIVVGRRYPLSRSLGVDRATTPHI